MRYYTSSYDAQVLNTAEGDHVTEIYNELNEILTEFINGMFRNQRVAVSRRKTEGFDRVKTKTLTSMHIAAKAKKVIRAVLSACTMHDMELVKYNSFNVVNAVRDLISLYDMPQSSLLVSLADLEVGQRVRTRVDRVRLASQCFSSSKI